MGSTAVRTFPKLIAAYHVLHRLLPPRHPPNALRSLDRSHLQCPPVLGKSSTLRREALLKSRTFSRIKHRNRKTRSHRTNPYPDSTCALTEPLHTSSRPDRSPNVRKYSWDAPTSVAGTQACSLYTMSRKPLRRATMGHLRAEKLLFKHGRVMRRMVEPVGIEPTT